jgi:hypothetical protein
MLQLSRLVTEPDEFYGDETSLTSYKIAFSFYRHVSKIDDVA